MCSSFSYLHIINTSHHYQGYNHYLIWTFLPRVPWQVEALFFPLAGLCHSKLEMHALGLYHIRFMVQLFNILTSIQAKLTNFIISASTWLQKPTDPATHVHEAYFTPPLTKENAICYLWGASFFLKLWWHKHLNKKYSISLAATMSFRYSSSRNVLAFLMLVGTAWLCLLWSMFFPDWETCKSTSALHW